ncbi:MAG: DUF202 domain-containing protein [Actinobacteria bacterium]|nr:DUF202 domain-containing protein [Actinomycetota bacterium]
MSTASSDPPVSRPRETQLDRTRLSWRRTTLTATVVLAIAAKEFVGGDVGAVTALAAFVLVGAWLALVLAAERRIADLIERDQTQASSRPALTVGLVLVIAAGGLLLSLLRG